METKEADKTGGKITAAAKQAMTAAATEAAAAAGADDMLVNAAEEPARKVQPLDRNRMKEAEFLRTVYVCTAHANTFPDDLLDPAYWAHCAEQLKPYDRIEARADDGTWLAEFVVLETSRVWARTHLLAKYDLTTPDVSLTQAKLQEFSVEYKGPAHKWSVIRLSDKEIIHDEEGTKAGAHAWLAERIRAGI